MTKVITLNLLCKLEEIEFYIYPVLLQNKDDLILIDAGYPNFLPQIEKAFQDNDLDINHLKMVIISHHDQDHMGAVKELISKYPKVKVKCSKEQIPYVLGQKSSFRIDQFERISETLEGAAKEENNKIVTMLKSAQHLNEVEELADQDKLFEDTLVIETPGHMDGHLSFYVESQNILIASDLLISDGGILDIASKELVTNKEAEIQSLKKILTYPIDKIICYHGGEYTSNNMKKELEEIIECGYVE